MTRSNSGFVNNSKDERSSLINREDSISIQQRRTIFPGLLDTFDSTAFNAIKAALALKPSIPFFTHHLRDVLNADDIDRRELPELGLISDYRLDFLVRFGKPFLQPITVARPSLVVAV